MRAPRSMPSLIRAVAAASVAVALVAGCGSSAGAGWTYAPQPSITPPPPASASPSAAPTLSAAPSSPGGSGPPTGPVITVVGLGIVFVPTQLEAPAGQPFTIDFDNQDAGIPHNIQIKDAGGASVFLGDIVTGPIQISYHVGPLAAGSYPFLCDVHPTTMTGTLTVR